MSVVESMVNRVAILGAESSGKTMLAQALAKHFDTVWVPEYLREFVETHQRVPREDEQLLIAKTQVQREREYALRAKAWLFCDTSPLMTAIYKLEVKRVVIGLDVVGFGHRCPFLCSGCGLRVKSVVFCSLGVF